MAFPSRIRWRRRSWCTPRPRKPRASLARASLTLGDAGAAVIVERAESGRPGIAFAGFTTIAEHSRLCLGMPSPRRPGGRMLTKARTIHDVALRDAPLLVKEVLEWE